MKTKKSLLQIIKSNQFALWIAILSVVVQSFHSFKVFYNASSLSGTAWGIAQGILFAIVIDLAILFYTLRNRRDIALGAALSMFIINAWYYYTHIGTIWDLNFLFGCFISAIIPVSVYFYSEEIHEEEIEDDNPYRYAQILEDRDEDHAKEIDSKDEIIEGLRESLNIQTLSRETLARDYSAAVKQIEKLEDRLVKYVTGKDTLTITDEDLDIDSPINEEADSEITSVNRNRITSVNRSDKDPLVF